MLLVLGIALTIAGVLFLVVSFVVNSAVSLGCGASGSPSCASTDPGSWLEWVGIPFVALGVFLLGVGLYWAWR